MLIRFIVANFLSFKDEIEFSMIKGKGMQHPDHVMQPSYNQLKLLKSAVIYGANASGKSNLIKAMNFARELIINGTSLKQRINISMFRLDATCATQPSKFEFEIVVNTKAYNYGFLLDATRIHEEWLYEILPSRERMLFERRTDEHGNNSIEFGIKRTGKRGQFLEFVGMGTRPNQLFLTESQQRNVEEFAPVFNWFNQNLTIIFPVSKPEWLEINFESNAIFQSEFQKLIRLFDTGIDEVRLHPVLWNDVNDIPNEMKELIKQGLLNNPIDPPRGLLRFNDVYGYVLTLNDQQEIQASKLKTTRSSQQGESVAFELTDESDGTQRLFDLIPAFMDLMNGEKVIVIDELDRSLHPHLSTKFLELFLQLTQNKPSQLLVTTHESGLLNLDLLRRDEIWFVEKDGEGISKTYSLEEYAPRNDKDIQKGYLLGRYGAIPILNNQLVLEQA
jgi:uncharacterized protein